MQKMSNVLTSFHTHFSGYFKFLFDKGRNVVVVSLQQETKYLNCGESVRSCSLVSVIQKGISISFFVLTKCQVWTFVIEQSMQ